MKLEGMEQKKPRGGLSSFLQQLNNELVQRNWQSISVVLAFFKEISESSRSTGLGTFGPE